MTFVWTLYPCPRCECGLRALRCGSGNTIGGVFWSDGSSDYPMLAYELGLQRCPNCLKFLLLREVGAITRLWDGEDNNTRLMAARAVIRPNGHDLWLALEQTEDWSKDEVRAVRRTLWWGQNGFARSLQWHRAACRRRDFGKRRYDDPKWDKLDEDRERFPTMAETESRERSVKYSFAIRLEEEAEARRIFALDCSLPGGPEFQPNLEELARSLSPELSIERLELAEIARELANFGSALHYRDGEFLDESMSAVEKIREHAQRREATVFCLNPAAL